MLIRCSTPRILAIYHSTAAFIRLKSSKKSSSPIIFGQIFGKRTSTYPQQWPKANSSMSDFLKLMIAVYPTHVGGIVIRVDGKGFHKFSTEHEYEKPNDIKALSLMNRAATSVMEEFKDVCLAYGQSDEYSFVFRKETQAYSRRSAKLSTNVCSLFTSAFVYYWNEHFPTSKPRYPPVFDGRTVLYPSNQNIRDYLSWRQADCHINNLYNTTFWALILKGGLTPAEAENKLKGTLSGDKNEILFSQFGLNYNTEPEMLRKGTVLVRRKVPVALPNGGTREKSQIVQEHVDIIGDEFWNTNSHLLTVT